MFALGLSSRTRHYKALRMLQEQPKGRCGWVGGGGDSGSVHEYLTIFMDKYLYRPERLGVDTPCVIVKIRVFKRLSYCNNTIT